MSDNLIVRGSVYWANLDPTIGSEIRKTRPAIIVSNNIQNQYSSRVIVIPITSSIEIIYPFEVAIMVNTKQSKALTDQIRTIDKRRLGDFICILTKSEMINLNKVIKSTLNLD